MDWPCHKNAWWAATKESILWRTSGGKGLPRWPEETLQRHPKSLPKGFQHTTRVLGTDCTGSISVALPHQKGSKWLGSKENQQSRKKAQRAQSQSHHQGISSESSLSAIIREHRQSRHSQPSSGNIIRVVTLKTDLLASSLQQTVEPRYDKTNKVTVRQAKTLSSMASASLIRVFAVHLMGS